MNVYLLVRPFDLTPKQNDPANGQGVLGSLLPMTAIAPHGTAITPPNKASQIKWEELILPAETEPEIETEPEVQLGADAVLASLLHQDTLLASLKTAQECLAGLPAPKNSTQRREWAKLLAATCDVIALTLTQRGVHA